MSKLYKAASGFNKSSAMPEFLGPITRARVRDLWCEDPDGHPSPSQRAACLKMCFMVCCVTRVMRTYV